MATLYISKSGARLWPDEAKPTEIGLQVDKTTVRSLFLQYRSALENEILAPTHAPQEVDCLMTHMPVSQGCLT